MAGLGKYTLRYKDYSDEESSVGYNSVALDGTNFDAQLVLAHNLRTATDGITLGARIGETVTAEQIVLSAATPTDRNCQRERKWTVVYRDNTQYYDFPSTAFPNAGYGKKFTVDVPTADLSLLTAAHSDTLTAGDTALAAAITAYITAFEAFQVSPYGGAAVVEKLVAVGRNL